MRTTKHCSLLLASLLLMASALASQTNTITVPITDRSEPGSPFALAGTVQITEELGETTVTRSFQDEFSGKNISGKTILTLVIWLEVQYPHGGMERDIRQYECYFAPDVINAGDTHVFSKVRDERTRAPFRGGGSGVGKAEAQVVFVEFLDGTSYGHRQFGEDMLSIRRKTEQALSKLEKTYDQRGESAFLTALQEQVEPDAVDTLIQNVRDLQRREGTEAAVAHIRRMLTFARERKAGLRGHGNAS